MPTPPEAWRMPDSWPRLLLQGGAVLGAGALLGIAAFAVDALPSERGPFLLLAVIFPFVAMVVGDLRKLLLALILLDIPFPLDTHLDYHIKAAEAGAIGGLGLSVTTASLLGLYALWIAELLTKANYKARPLLRASLPPALYVGLATLSAFFAHDAGLSLFEVVLLWQTLLLFLYVASTVRTRQEVLFIVAMLLIGLVLEGLVILASQLLGHSLPLPGIEGGAGLSTERGGSFYRAGGTLGSPNVAAGYLSIALMLPASVLLTKLALPYKGLAALALGLGGVALILTFSRGGWVAFGLAMAILVLPAWRRGWLSPGVPLAMAALAVLPPLVFPDALAARLSGEVADNGRIPLVQLAFRMIEQNPVLGIGPNNFAVAMLQYATPELAYAWLYTVHNKYLLVWAETGTGGLLAFLLFLSVTVSRGWRCWRSNDRLIAALGLGLAAAMLGHMVHMLVDIFNDRQPIQLVWLIAALLAALPQVEEQSNGAR